MERIKTRTGEFFVDENTVLHVIMFNDVIVDYEDANFERVASAICEWCADSIACKDFLDTGVYKN